MLCALSPIPRPQPNLDKTHAGSKRSHGKATQEGKKPWHVAVPEAATLTHGRQTKRSLANATPEPQSIKNAPMTPGCRRNSNSTAFCPWTTCPGTPGGTPWIVLCPTPRGTLQKRPAGSLPSTVTLATRQPPSFCCTSCTANQTQGRLNSQSSGMCACCHTGTGDRHVGAYSTHAITCRLLSRTRAVQNTRVLCHWSS